MRRSSESSQHDENPRRRGRRNSSQDRRHSDVGEHVPTSPIAVPFMGPPSGNIPSSPADRVSPHGGGNMVNFSQGMQRGQSNMELSPRSAFPHSVVSPSRYQSASPVYAPHSFPTSNISTPSCATPTNVTYTVSPRTPDFFPGMQDPSLSPSRPMGDPGFPAQSPNFFSEHKPGFPEFSVPSPRDQFSAGPSPGGTMHHHAYPPRRPSVPLQGSAAYPAQLSPSAKIPRSQGPPSSAGVGQQSRVYGSGSWCDQSDGSPLKKRPTLKIPTHDSGEVTQMKQTVVEYYMEEMETIKANFREKLKEIFFLQNGGNMMDYLVWKRRPPPQLMVFLDANPLDTNASVSTPVATNTVSPLTKIPPSYAWPQPPKDPNAFVSVSSSANTPVTPKPAFEQPNVDPGMMIRPPTNFNTKSSYQRQHSMPDSMQTSTPSFGSSQSNPWNSMNMQKAYSQPPTQNPHLAPPLPVQNRNTFVTPEQGVSSSHHITLLQSSHVNSGVANGPSVSARPNPTMRTQSLTSVLDNSFGSHEDIAMEAKKEAEVLKRVSELRKEGLWTQRRLPKVQEMPRCKAHWDYLLEEMQWLATDFVQERRWKRGIAKKLSRAVLKYHQEQKSKEIKAEKVETVRLKRIASSIAKEIKQFWASVEKVVQYKVQSRLEEKRKKALDLQLNFIVDQTEKYSSWLAKSLKVKPSSTSGSAAPSSVSSPMSSRPQSDAGSDFGPDDRSDIEVDDEETIDIEEAEESQGNVNHEKEIALLKEESEIPLEQLIEKLPPGMLEERSDDSMAESGREDSLDDDSDEETGHASPESEGSEVDVEGNDDKETAKAKEENKTEQQKDSKAEKPDGDEEFVVTGDMEEGVDDEQTLEEEEKMEGEGDHSNEIAALQKEGEIPIEELLEMYGGTQGDSTDLPSDEELSEESSEEELSEEECTEFLVKDEQGESLDLQGVESDPDQDLTDAAATAESLQPKGFTLETTTVQTKVPFLLRGTLREYQLIGLDWLVTMHQKHLNGILADEMGLGKTIQTISLLAHLACDKGIWGPHLIVVPTSVMLNWEMELKKWCPAFKILTYYGNQKERKAKRQGWTKPNAFHVCITSYKLVVQDHQSFRRKKWKYLILDEAQNIKNFKSQRWQYLLNFNSQRRLLLTGTPLQNSLMELWSLMHFLMPHLFQSHKDFKEWFSNPLSGMIEGSREYNEGLVKRLHKVLRPFLLRRLKSEVEKQMPKKYEHVVRCRLSKRQRFLYDDFMSKTKTKETLQSGHFLSVINILMQLRKVCNHPDLFEGRPVVSAFQMQGLVFHTASLVLTALDYHPLSRVRFGHLNLCIADIERTITSYADFRTQLLQTPRQLIVEVDSVPPRQRYLVPPAKPRRPSASPHPMAAATLRPDQANSAHPPGIPYSPAVHPPSSEHRAYHASSVAGAPFGSTPSWPHELPGYLRQPYTGALLTPTSPGRLPLDGHKHGYMTRHSAGPGLHQGGYGRDALPPPYPGQGSYMPYGYTPCDSVSPGLFPNQEGRTDLHGKVSVHATPLVTSRLQENRPEEIGPKPYLVSPTKKIALDKPPVRDRTTDRRSSPFYLESLVEKRAKARKEKLARLANINRQHCAVKAVFGLDLVEAVMVARSTGCSRGWFSDGTNSDTVPLDVLSDMVKTPLDRAQDMAELFSRFAFVVPPAEAPRITMHASHAPPSFLNKERDLESALHTELAPKTALLHPIVINTRIQMPEARLIQYDCGKLQTLNVLLRELKTEKHRVLIFTQMTKMLDVLESFLNYHGHIYLRLDGTTRVEQRQILMERFNADPRIFCFILSTRSGGLGVNLTGADTVIFYDSDWNPTMDAQAQDRCHRIGQTRDVHIYRLISERTVEENILKKANQKRLLGDLAIEGGNFTTAFFKETTIKDLFNVEAGLMDSQPVEVKKQSKESEKEAAEKPEAASEPSEAKVAQNLFEQALFKAEDEQDACAATRAKAEQAAELAEFDEGIPYNEDGKENQRDEQISRVEEELQTLESQLNPVERYALRFLEQSGCYITAEQIKAAEAQVELAKKDWELDHLQALKELEEKRAAEEDDEILFTYSREDAAKVKKSKSKRSSRSNKCPSSRRKPQIAVCAGPQTSDDGGETVRHSQRKLRPASRASSRTSSCSSSGRIIKHKIPLDADDL